MEDLSEEQSKSLFHSERFSKMNWASGGIIQTSLETIKSFKIWTNQSKGSDCFIKFKLDILKPEIDSKLRLSSQYSVHLTLIHFFILLVVATIIDLGNQVLQNMGVEEPIDDVSVFFR